ncbi:MAG: rhomboid family intramembrane serine protease [Bacteroidota bacterium]
MEYQPSPMQELKAFFSRRSALANLIWINAGVFVFVNVTNLVFWLFSISNLSSDPDISAIISWLAVPSDPAQLIHKPWTILTYMFLQENFLHLLFNMMVLFFGGQLLNQFLDKQKLILTYLLSGIWGAVFFIVAFNKFPVFAVSVPYAVALGSSASVLGILVAAATWSPNFQVKLFLFGSVKLKHIALILIVMDIVSIQRENPGGHIAHLGGAFWGFVYIQLLRRFPASRQLGSFSWKKFSQSLFRKQKSKFRVYPGERQRPVTDEQYNARKNEQQETIDSILDKISKRGYEALTKEEKDLLFKSGNTKNQD